jgi:glycosidase
MRDQSGRDKPDGRHGGDLQGIIDHADYLDDLGVTALWLNPPQVNDMQYTSYHGYAITDHYQIDPRLGSNKLMRTLVDTFHERNMKIVMDVVLNHCGSEHFLAQDPPAPDWFNEWPSYTQSSFRISAMSDPYAASADRQKMAGGWFAGVMPDFNQRNPMVMNYLTQNCIWWIEYAGLDGLRLDTQPFSFKEGVAEWAGRIRDEYPNINLVGEVWQYSPAQTAYWQADAANKDGYNSYMPSVTDFQLHDALKTAFGEEDGWETGMSRLYLLLGKDGVYPRPDMLLTFPDNHDATRFFSAIGEDFAQWKMAMTFLLTTRGIPCLYYGTELLFTGMKEKGDADLRKDFPGGWDGDERNAFTSQGRTDAENVAFEHLQKLLNYRKRQPVLHHGKLEHYMPEAGVYVYFRYDAETKVMVVLNNTSAGKELDLGRFASSFKGFTQARDIMSGKMLEKLEVLDLEGKSATVLELIR